MEIKLDDIDIRLINMLQVNSKQSIKELASKLNLSIAPVHERIKKLERTGIVKGYVAIVDLEKIDKSMINYIMVTISKHDSKSLKDFEHQVCIMDEVQECAYIAGNHDYLLKVACKDMKEYQEFLLNKLSKLKMIANFHSQFAIKHVKFKTGVTVVK